MRRWTLLVLLVAACGPARAPAAAEGEGTYPGVLHPPEALTPDMAVEQHVVVRKGTQSGAFDGVLQKRGSELVLVGLGPANVRAFVLRQEGDDARLEQTMGPTLPFPPRNILLDVHRAFFKRLPPGTTDGTRRGALDGEEVTEIWSHGALLERRYERPELRGAVRVFYGPGCGEERCEPASLRIVNEWFGYAIEIENRRFHALQKS